MPSCLRRMNILKNNMKSKRKSDNDIIQLSRKYIDLLHECPELMKIDMGSTNEFWKAAEAMDNNNEIQEAIAIYKLTQLQKIIDNKEWEDNKEILNRIHQQYLQLIENISDYNFAIFINFGSPDFWTAVNNQQQDNDEEEGIDLENVDTWTPEQLSK